MPAAYCWAEVHNQLQPQMHATEASHLLHCRSHSVIGRSQYSRGTHGFQWEEWCTVAYCCAELWHTAVGWGSAEACAALSNAKVWVGTAHCHGPWHQLDGAPPQGLGSPSSVCPHAPTGVLLHAIPSCANAAATEGMATHVLQLRRQRRVCQSAGHAPVRQCNLCQMRPMGSSMPCS